MLTALVGTISTLVGIIVGQFLSASREHAKWVNDYKRSEYRELLDLLNQMVTVVADNRPNLKDFNTQPINGAVAQMARALADRIFIADTLAEIGATEDWKNLVRVIYYEPALQDVTPTELRYTVNNLRDRGDALRKKILEQAKKDIVKFKLVEL